jgi:hypothetical protein
MEQRLDATYLRHGTIDWAVAAALVAAGLGVGVFLAAWGVSLLWRYTPPVIAVRFANPEVHIAQDAPLVVKQDAPFALAAPNPLKIEQGQLTFKVEQSPSLPMSDRLGSTSQTAAGDVNTTPSHLLFARATQSRQRCHGMELQGWQGRHAGQPILLLHGSQSGGPVKQACRLGCGRCARAAAQLE